MQASKEIQKLATEFQQSIPDLFPNTTDYAFFHDALHRVLGLGVTLEDEASVLQVEVLLGGRDLPEDCIEAATDHLAKISSDLLVEFCGFYTSHFEY
jgi:hypothetical protein